MRYPNRGCAPARSPVLPALWRADEPCAPYGYLKCGVYSVDGTTGAVNWWFQTNNSAPQWGVVDGSNQLYIVGDSGRVWTVRM